MKRPKRFVNYDKYVFFMSHLAHELKRMGVKEFTDKYSKLKYHGLYKRYLDGYIEYINNKESNIQISVDKYPDVLVVDPYVYTMYFKVHDKDELSMALNNAIPEFLKRGILLTEVQEAVHAKKTMQVLNTLKIENNTSIIIDSNGFGIKTGDIIQDENGGKHKILSVGMSNTHKNICTTPLLIEGAFNSSKIFI